MGTASPHLKEQARTHRGGVLHVFTHVAEPSHTPPQYLPAATVTFARGARCFSPAAVRHWPGKESRAGGAGWQPGWLRAPLAVIAQERFQLP